MGRPITIVEPIVRGNRHRLKIGGRADNGTPIPIVDAKGVVINSSTWVLVQWFLRTTPTGDVISPSPLTTSLGGTYDPDPRENTQNWSVELTPTQTEALEEGTYFFAWKRMDPGYEWDLAHGQIRVLRTASR